MGEGGRDKGIKRKRDKKTEREQSETDGRVRGVEEIRRKRERERQSQKKKCVEEEYLSG